MLDRISPCATAAVFLAALAVAAPVMAQDVVINEFWTHDASPEGSPEFIELHSATGVNLGGLSLIIVDGNTSNPASFAFRRVRLRIDFAAGESIDAAGYYLIGGGMPAEYEVDRPIPFSSIPNTPITIAIVRTQDIQMSEVDDGELSEASMQAITANLIDAIAITDGDVGDPVHFNAPALGENTASAPWDAGARMPDGIDTDSAGDWSVQDNFTLLLGSDQDVLSTPGHSNDTPGGACCLPGGQCLLLAAADCVNRGGTYAGNDSTCDSVICATGGGGPGPDDCLCETDGQEGTTVFDLLNFLDCWFEGCP